MADYRLIGTSQTPKDLRAKVTGRSKYAEDFRADGMVFAKLLLSPVPHGQVRGIDTRRALAMDGVLAVITASDLEDAAGGGSAPASDYQGVEPVLTNVPRYQGQPIAAVAATDETLAAEAVAALEPRDRSASLCVGSVGHTSAGRAEPTRGWECIRGQRCRRGQVDNRADDGTGG